MQRDFKFFSQISTSHSSVQKLDRSSLRKAVSKAQSVLPLSGLIVGSLENEAVFDELTRKKQEDDPEIYLWYNLLSDYPGQNNDQGIVDYHGNACKSWFGWDKKDKDEVSERFRFSCPNNPDTRQKTLNALSNFLQMYPFDGVFLDKFRFPSPANGLDQTFSCFCSYCRAKADKQGLDLAAVQEALRFWDFKDLAEPLEGRNWLEIVTSNKRLLQQFLKFRIESISELVKQVHELTTSLGIKLGLDLFTPAFADLVGESYSELSPYADWVKPMIYQYAMGPAGIRLETKAFIEGLEREFGVSEDSFFSWTAVNLPWLTRDFYARVKNSHVPSDWIEQEIREAVRLMSSCPVYIGLECVSFPGVIDIRPNVAAKLFDEAYENGADGAVLSWDLMHMPLENLQKIKEHYDCRV